MENIPLRATAHIKITKINDSDDSVVVEEHDVELTEEEARKLWHSQQQA